ncbi:DUF21-domain-containing protein [Amniculicola lignicola CBS 123094]|uniref:DUF21-domain-containing protein n=1 Tax=Amniculicola lignicola CBS 123094 TaxID=1392246 RepID=A0A6A5WEC3_9PLEO|nr:DUF21-domain-containing protein [Amniculicola lignicola CBS 123094]
MPRAIGLAHLAVVNLSVSCAWGLFAWTLSFAQHVSGMPLEPHGGIGVWGHKDDHIPAGDPQLWVYLSVAMVLVLLGGVFAGLTIALMGQDEIYLQVLAESGEASERRNAKKVLKLLNKGKHWVLVTLLLSNVITNETLPIVLDRSLGGGWPAVVGSTVLIVIFGEVVPQSICVRYGLPIGAWMAPLVEMLMWLMAIVAWPTAKLLDYLLGADHGTVYKKAGLKTLVTLHRTLGPSPEDRLNEDEVTIISAVLDLKAKTIASIMTPMDDVFTLSEDAILNEEMMDTIQSAGYSRIPIHSAINEKDWVGMLLVKMLITYDPEDALPVKDFALATLPETYPYASCLDIINYFQQGKSHMVLVSDSPGEPYGAIGVATLEDVIEELIGEEIVDESDVFIDVHKAVRRLAPAPHMRLPKRGVPPQRPSFVKVDSESQIPELRKGSFSELGTSPKTTTYLVRRRSSGANGTSEGTRTVLRGNDPAQLREHLKHLGPSNPSSRPQASRISTVKIKPGVPATIKENSQLPQDGVVLTPGPHAPVGGVGEGLLSNAGREASDGVHSLNVGYGTIGTPSQHRSSFGSTQSRPTIQPDAPTWPKSSAPDETSPLIVENPPPPHIQRSASKSTIGSLHSVRSRSKSPIRKRHTARSGSISENVKDVNGIKKVVLETTSSSDSEDKGLAGQKDGGHEEHHEDDHSGDDGSKGDDKKTGKKRRKNKKRGKKKKAGQSENGESEPLLGNDHS